MKPVMIRIAPMLMIINAWIGSFPETIFSMTCRVGSNNVGIHKSAMRGMKELPRRKIAQSIMPDRSIVMEISPMGCLPINRAVTSGRRMTKTIAAVVATTP